MKSTPGNFEAKRLANMFKQGTIITPDKARDSAFADVVAECNDLWESRRHFLTVMLEGISRDIVAGDIELTDAHVEGLVKVANGLARAITKRKLEEVEEIIAATGAKRQKGYLYLCALLGVEAIESEEEQPSIVQAPAAG
jgi:hypothetical protein